MNVFESQCDVVLVDSFEARFIEGLLEQDSNVKMLLFGMNEDAEVFLKAVQLGVCGYLLKEASAAEIVAAVRAAARGEATCPPALCMALIQHLSKRRRERIDFFESAGGQPKVPHTSAAATWFSWWPKA